MGDFSLMASAAFTPSILSDDHSLLKNPKELQTLHRYGGIQIGAPHRKDQCQVSSLLAGSSNQLYMGDPVIKEHVRIDVEAAFSVYWKDETVSSVLVSKSNFTNSTTAEMSNMLRNYACPDSVLFSYGVAEQCTRHEKLLKFLTSGSSITEGDISLIYDLIGSHAISTDMSSQSQPYLPIDAKFCLYDVGMECLQQFLHLQKQLYPSKSLLDIVGNLSHTSTITVHPNGNVSFSDSGSWKGDLVSLVEEFDLSKRLVHGSKKAMVVPYFTWKRGGYSRTKVQESFPKLETLTDSSLKSSGNSKLKPMPKKKRNRKAGRERDMHTKNYFRACESLLNVYLDKEGDRTVILSLKNSSPELTEVLHQLSAGIAGTGLAVLLSIACKSINGRILPLSSAKLFNVSFGLGLFWLSWAVNGLQDTISHYSKKSNRGSRLNGEMAITKEVKRSVNEILFRGAALLAMGFVRLVL